MPGTIVTSRVTWGDDGPVIDIESVGDIGMSPGEAAPFLEAQMASLEDKVAKWSVSFDGGIIRLRVMFVPIVSAAPVMPPKEVATPAKPKRAPVTRKRKA